MNFTSPKQSERLLSLGLPRETADMAYRLVEASSEYGVMPVLDKPYLDELPCWSLTALFELLPVGDFNLVKNALSMYKLSSNVYTNPTAYNQPIQAVFNAVEWMLEHKLINTESNG